MISEQLIIIGGGASIKHLGVPLLRDITQDRFTVSLNYAYNYFPETTFLSFVDDTFYKDNINDLKELPLIVGKHWDHLEPQYLPNTIALKTATQYCRDIKDGVYVSRLVGVFALALGIYLLDQGEIFLLGYDYGSWNGCKDFRNRLITHFYQGDIEHRGVGQVGTYNLKEMVKDFGPFTDEKKVKIYNVSLVSRIPYFPRISFSKFLNMLRRDAVIDQDKARWLVRESLRKAQELIYKRA